MKYISVVQTFDGKTHATRRDAFNHLNKLYADILNPLAHKLNHKSFDKVAEWVDSNLEQFTQLAIIRADRVGAENHPDEDDET